MKLNTFIFTLICLAVGLFSCRDTATSLAKETTVPLEASAPAPDPSDNPPAPGFNATASSPRAVSIADSVVWAYGGRQAYDQNRYFSWNFFGARDLLWDKQEKLVRIDFPSKNAIYLLDYSDMSGRAQIDGEEITHPDSLSEALSNAHGIWINDSYWLVHQFKLKDSGVTLSYEGVVDADPETARPSYVIDQTFENVGNTPGNRYRLFIDQATYKINTWQFFRDAADEEASMQTPWKDENTYNGVVLSADRGGRFQLGNISAPTKVDATRFEEF